MTRSNVSSSASVRMSFRPGEVMPALLMRTSSRPKRLRMTSSIVARSACAARRSPAGIGDGGSGGLDEVDGFFRVGFGTDSVEGDVVAFGGEFECNAEADAAGAAGDEGNGANR